MLVYVYSYIIDGARRRNTELMKNSEILVENNSQNNITYINEMEVDAVIKVTLTNEILKKDIGN